ncbi:MAG: PH domain-containing protein [Clostridiales bacterium]|nr:PH domain-containing protein [Clostridiales bacterium]
MDTGKYRTLSNKAIKLMRITSVIFSFFVFIVPGTALAVFSVIQFGSKSAAACFAAASFLLSVLYITITPKIRFKRYKYLIASDRIEVIEGLFFISRTIVPIDRIYQIDIKTGPLDNAVGVAKVIITTAGSFTSFRFLEPEAAEEVALYINETVLQKLKAKGAES